MDPRDALVWLFARMPLSLADKLSWFLAYLWWFVLPIRRKVAVDNLNHAFPELAPRPVLTRMMHDIVLSYVELLQFDRIQIEVRGAEAVAAAPGPVLAGHLGAWDLFVLASADRLPMTIFFRRPTDPWTRRFMDEQRAAHRVDGLADGARMSAAYEAFSAGRAVYFVIDQWFGKGIESPFLGRPAKTATGFAAAILKSGRPAWCQTGWREGVGRHVTCIQPFPMPPLSGNFDVDLQAITDAANAFIAAEVRKRPHGWLWLHRRWK